jgi:hypothetical protein
MPAIPPYKLSIDKLSHIKDVPAYSPNTYIKINSQNKPSLVDLATDTKLIVAEQLATGNNKGISVIADSHNALDLTVLTDSTTIDITSSNALEVMDGGITSSKLSSDLTNTLSDIQKARYTTISNPTGLVTIGQVVFTSSTGVIYPADATNITTLGVLGVVTDVYTSLNNRDIDVATVCTGGEIPYSGLTAGSYYYLNSSAGLTTSPQSTIGYLQLIGIASTNNTLIIDITNPILF